MPPDRPLLLVHGTFASQQEIESLAERFGDRLSWVLCPRSNDYIEGARLDRDPAARRGPNRFGDRQPVVERNARRSSRS
ncbi:MAG: hypothetical protein ACLTTP_05790 [Alistipes ihumii]